MIETVDQINRILDVEPDIDPEVFWPRVGISPAAVMVYGKTISRATGVSFGTIMAAIESGAMLVEHTMKGGTI